MRVSPLSEIRHRKVIIDAFGGYNNNLKIRNYEFSDMRNLTSDYYPLLSPRRGRGVYAYSDTSAQSHDPGGIISKDTLCYVDNTKLYINNVAVAGLTLSAGRKQLISFGAYIIIMPDKKYVNTLDTTDKGDIDASFTQGVQAVSVTMCDLNGDMLSSVSQTGIYVGTSAPSTHVGGDYWLDKSTKPYVLRCYSSTTNIWVTVTNPYLKINTTGIGNTFKEGDAVDFSGTTVEGIDGETSVVWKSTTDMLIVSGIIGSLSDGWQTPSISVLSGFSASRSMPSMDFIVESGNRLWGCKYGNIGTGGNVKIVNEIYASKLGDFKNWRYFAGTSMDSYIASCGTDGPFTGAITHLGYPLFFKEDCLHKVYGNYPSNFQVQNTACRGVQKGCGESLAIVNGVLFYKGINGVFKYDGSLPVEVSTEFGDIHYTGLVQNPADPLRAGAVGGAFQNKYYLSALSETTNTWTLLVYDTRLGLWHKEDDTRASSFCAHRDNLYYIDEGDKTIKTVIGSGAEGRAKFDWYAVSGNIGASSSVDYATRRGVSPTASAYISRADFKMSMKLGASVAIYIQYDSKERWEHIATVNGTTEKTFVLPVRPKRCDHFKYMLVGEGEAKLYALTLVVEDGSDLRR